MTLKVSGVCTQRMMTFCVCVSVGVWRDDVGDHDSRSDSVSWRGKFGDLRVPDQRRTSEEAGRLQRRHVSVYTTTQTTY